MLGSPKTSGSRQPRRPAGGASRAEHLGDPNLLADSLARHVRYSLGKRWDDLGRQNYFRAIALAVRDQLVDRMLETEALYERSDAKRLYYLSMEFLMGRSLGNNLLNIGLFDACREMLGSMDVDLEEIRETECDAALGNGGLGRLAACFLDSLATLGLPGFGYGINYEFGLFQQVIDEGQQREKPDAWRGDDASPWQLERPDEAVVIPLYGRIEHIPGRDGGYNPVWQDWRTITGVPYDMPVVGYGGRTVNYLRLYSARASDEFDIEIFNRGDYLRAVEQKMVSETVSKVLYPSDSVDAGKELRLVQEYFFVACALRDIVKRYRRNHATFDAFPDRVAIQLNDTHPALAVAELMRVLIDENGLEWEEAFEITRSTIAYTNHTLLPEALERWPVPLFERVLPRHLQIVYEINSRFLAEVERRWPGDGARAVRTSIIEEGGIRHVRMAHLAIVGSHSVNGVSALHSKLVASDLVPDFHELWPERFNNKTNGVTQRRWVLKANPGLSALITSRIGDGWVTDLDRLRELEAAADDDDFRTQIAAVKRANKKRLAAVIAETTGEHVDPSSLFDVQAKRIHEYKRQLLNLMGIVHFFLRLVEDGDDSLPPRTWILAGKAAPGYHAAKQIIRLVHALGETVNRHPVARERMRVVFIPDYRVSLAEKIIPAADLSEQISTAGMEASGTGNMKFAMNGALTIGTLDGANVEMLEEIGEDAIYIFGHTTPEIEAMRRAGSYDPRATMAHDPRVARVMHALRDGRVAARDPSLPAEIFDQVMGSGDRYFHLADLGSYLDTQLRVGADSLDAERWGRKVIRNIARMGKFSSDRTIREYARDIWGMRAL